MKFKKLGLIGFKKSEINFFKKNIGKALIGKDKGEMVSVNTPSGEKNFEILDVNYI